MSLIDRLRNDTKGLAKAYAFYTNNASFKEFAYDDNQAVKTALKGPATGFNRIDIKKNFQIARLTPRIAMTDRGESLTISPSFDPASVGVPAYFLPWDNRGAAVRLTIPNRSLALSEAEHPKIFFTAVLSGCSIIFKGTAQNPTIYHCGTEGGEVGTPTVGNSNDFFRNMLTGAGYRPVAGQIRSTDYMVPKVGSPAVVQLEKDLFNSLLAQRGLRSKGFNVKEVNVWGACFGIRNGADWTFYVQKNATISYTKVEEVLATKEVEKKAYFGLGTKTVTQTYITTKMTPGQRIARPIEVTRVFPGAGTVKMTPTWNFAQLASELPVA